MRILMGYPQKENVTVSMCNQVRTMAISVKTLSAIVLLLCCGSTFCASAALSYELVRRSFEENVRESDVIVIGSVTSERHDVVTDPGGLAYVSVAVIDVLKGQSEASIEFLVAPTIAEANPRCCIRGETYLLLLKRLGPGRYEAVNGRYGVHKVK
jgi:hypothetical protein